MENNNWQLLHRLVKIKSSWVTLLEERYLDHANNEINYWRVEKADSIIIIPVCHNKFIFPNPTFRPGAGKITLDFPGGRVLKEQALHEAARDILHRELNIKPKQQIQISLKQIYSQGLYINSSFSSQKIFGFVAHIDASHFPEQFKDLITYDINQETFNYLSKELECFQCRSLLMEYWLIHHT